jgi:hypothetical protein
MRDTQVRHYSGVPMHEVQLGTDVDVEDGEAVNAALARALEENERLNRGELRKVKVAGNARPSTFPSIAEVC